MMDMAAEKTTLMTIAGGVAAAVVKVARVAKVLASPARDPASLARDLASRARDLASPARDLLEADPGGAQRLAMMIGAIGVTAAAAAAPASLARDGESKKYDTHATCVLITCTVMM